MSCGMSWWSSFFSFSGLRWFWLWPSLPRLSSWRGCRVPAAPVPQTRAEADHCLPFLSRLDGVSGVRDSSLHLGTCSGLHVKPGEPASAAAAKGAALS